MEDESVTSDESESLDTEEAPTDETPEHRPSRQQERDHAPDGFTVGYEPTGETRVGIGSADGDIERLVRHNEGRHRSDGSHSAREAARDKKRVTQAFCSVLGVTPHQQREAVTAMGKLNLDRFGHQKRLEKVALATIKVVVEQDRFDRVRRNLGQANLADIGPDRVPNRMRDDDQFCDLIEEYDVSGTDLFRVSQLVKRELKNRNHSGQTAAATSRDDTENEESPPGDR